MATYKVIKFSQHTEKEVVETGLTKEQAVEICTDPSTKGEGWFYGWTIDSDSDNE